METVKKELKAKSKSEMTLYYHFAATKGGKNRMRIIQALTIHPMSINQIAMKTKLTYCGILYHIKILEKNDFISSFGEKYGKIYSLSEQIEKNKKFFNDMKLKV